MDNNNTTMTTETEYLRQENEMFRAEIADLTRRLNHTVSKYDVLKLEHQLIKEYDLWEAIGDEKLEGNILATAPPDANGKKLRGVPLQHMRTQV